MNCKVVYSKLINCCCVHFRIGRVWSLKRSSQSAIHGAPAASRSSRSVLGISSTMVRYVRSNAMWSDLANRRIILRTTDTPFLRRNTTIALECLKDRRLRFMIFSNAREGLALGSICVGYSPAGESSIRPKSLMPFIRFCRPSKVECIAISDVGQKKLHSVILQSGTYRMDDCPDSVLPPKKACTFAVQPRTHRRTPQIRQISLTSPYYDFRWQPKTQTCFIPPCCIHHSSFFLFHLLPFHLSTPSAVSFVSPPLHLMASSFDTSPVDMGGRRLSLGMDYV